MVTRAASQTLAAQIASLYVSRIRDRWLSPGARLPSVRQCAITHDISPSTVVAAYDLLVAQGWVEVRRNRGFFVRDMRQSAAAPVASPLPAVPLSAASLIRGMFHRRSERAQPGMGVLPPQWLENDFLATGLRKVMTQSDWGEVAGQYGEPAGDSALRQTLAAKLNDMHLKVSADQIITTMGATHALDIVSRTLLRPGDCVMVEEPGWAIEFARLQSLGMRILPVPRRQEGPDLAVMQRYCELHAPKLFVSVSVLHNPTGLSLSPASAHQVVTMAHRHQFHVVEDDTYSHLAPEHATRLSVLDGLSRTIYVSGFAKILAPNWRVGYLAAPTDLFESLLDTKLLTTLTTPALFERTLAACIGQGQMRRHADRIRQQLGEARSRSVKLAAAHGCQFVHEPAGLFGWVDVGVNTDQLAVLMHDEGYLLAPGSLFHADRQPTALMRINFAAAQEPSFWRAFAKCVQRL